MSTSETDESNNFPRVEVEVAIFIFLLMGLIATVLFFTFLGWPSEFPNEFCNFLTLDSFKEFLDQKNQVRNARLQFITTLAAIWGGIAAFVSIYYTGKRAEAFEKNAIAAQKTVQLTEQGQITERFTKAIEQLGNEKLEIRLGGIYALERLAKDSQRDSWTIMEVLAAFIREKAPLKQEEEAEKAQLPKMPTDIQAALTVIGRRNWKDPKNQSLDLSNTDLRGANLNEANLKGVLLIKASLKGTNLNGANLQGANLYLAKLQQTELNEANLQGVRLNCAKLQGARLRQANLKGAELSEADLVSAFLSQADLEGTDLFRAKLQKASLSEAKNLNLEQVTSAYGNSQTILPEEFIRPKHWQKSE